MLAGDRWSVIGGRWSVVGDRWSVIGSGAVSGVVVLLVVVANVLFLVAERIWWDGFDHGGCPSKERFLRRDRPLLALGQRAQAAHHL